MAGPAVAESTRGFRPGGEDGPSARSVWRHRAADLVLNIGADFARFSSRMPTCRLIYRSLTSWDILTNDMLATLEREAQRKNQEAGITGLLVLSGESFLQVLEGRAAHVNALYAKILADERHRKVQLLSYEQIGRRCFEDWGMRVADLNDLPAPDRSVFRAKYRERDGYVSIPDDAPTALALLFDARALCAAGAAPA